MREWNEIFFKFRKISFYSLIFDFSLIFRRFSWCPAHKNELAPEPHSMLQNAAPPDPIQCYKMLLNLNFLKNNFEKNFEKKNWHFFWKNFLKKFLKIFFKNLFYFQKIFNWRDTKSGQYAIGDAKKNMTLPRTPINVLHRSSFRFSQFSKGKT